MKTSIALVAALLLAPVACARHPQAAPTAAVAAAEPIDPGPAVQPSQPPAPAVTEPDPQPSAEEVAAFNTKVPK